MTQALAGSRAALALRCCLVILATAAGLPASAAPQPAKSPEAWLQGELARLVQDRRLGGARAGVLVQELRSGRVLFAHQADELVPVASNVKLVTAAAALANLGPHYRFRTAVYATERDGTTVKGPLVLKGFGDPSLSAAHLTELAEAVREAGVKEVVGGLLIDESFFDAARLPPLYETRKTDMYYRPLVSALSIHENAVAIRVRAGDAPAAPARVALRPASSYFRLSNRVLTATKRRRSFVRIRLRPAGNRMLIEVSGRVRPGYRGRWERRRIEHPAQLAGATFLDALQRAGVQLRSRRVALGRAPEGRPLAVRRSAALPVLLRYMMKTSSNFVAEQVLKVVGAEVEGPPGTWAKGLNVAARHLGGLRIAAGSYAMKNGSGLYEGNRFTPRQLCTVLRAAGRDFRYGADYMAALAVAGVDGTLAHRFIGSGAEAYVRAKTGTLADVVALAGYAGSAARRDRLVFAVELTGLPPGHVPRARQVADAIAQALVVYLER